MRAITSRPFRTSYTKSSVLYRSALAAALMVTVTANNAYATGLNETPQGGVITAGTGTINNTIPGHTQIDLNTSQSIIDWQSFNIGQNASVNYNMLAGASSVSLNRIHDQNVSQILGSLTANGKLVLVNPNGVFFGAGSRVDVAGLVASTADISNADFLAGRTNFNIAGRADASIINKGTITAAEGGLVALVAPSVRNDGVIQARSGAVRIGAAETFTVDFYGDNLYSFALGSKTTAAGKDENGNKMDSAIENNGTISAQGGSILLTANAAKDIVTNAVNNTGIIEASSAHMVGGTIVLGGGDGHVNVSGKVKATGTKGGNITVTGKTIGVIGAEIDASGQTAGGTVKIGGDYQGGGDLAHADTVWFDENSLINVSALDSGNGGTAILWSDVATQFDGGILAKGGINGGNGGLVETSSLGALGVLGGVDASAAKDANGNFLGEMGNWLLDPRNIIISDLGTTWNWGTFSFIPNPNTGTSNTSGGGTTTTTSNADSAKVNSQVVTSALNGGTNVIVKTGSTSSATPQLGDITVDAELSWIGKASLTLEAIHDIIVNKNISSTVIGLTGGSTTLNAGNNITLNNANINANTVGSINLIGRDVALNGSSSLYASTGDITVSNSGKFSSTQANSINAVLGGISINQNLGGRIQNAVEAIGNYNILKGAKVLLGAGTFNEQVTIDGKTNFTLKGAGAANTFITAPNSLSTTANVFGTDHKAVIGVKNGNFVTIDGLTVDGLSKGDANYRFTGIGYYNAGGEIMNTHVTNIKNNPANGVQGGNGIYAFNDSGIRLLSIHDNTVDNFQKNGITVNSNGAADYYIASVSDNTITGLGAVDFIAQNGIQFGYGTRGLINGNSISGIGYTDYNSYEAAGILLYQAGDNLLVSNNIITGTGVDTGIYSYGSNGTILTGNEITGSRNGITVDSAKGGLIATNKLNSIGNTAIALYNVTDGAIITGNTGTGMYKGVYSELSEKLQVLGNQFAGITGLGLDLLYAGEHNIVGNTLTAAPGSNGYGIRLIGGNDSNVVGNTLTNFNLIGLWAVGSNDLNIAGNTINNSDTGVMLDNSDRATMTLNTIDNSKVAAIASTNSSGHNIFINFLTNVQGDGIDLRGVSDSAFTGNFITSAAGNSSYNNLTGATGGSGITSTFFDGANYIGNRYTGNVISGFNATGIRINGVGNATLKTNIITNGTNPAAWGIALTHGANNNIVDSLNVITGGNGIASINASDNTIANNILLGITGDGIRVYGSKGAGHNTNANVYANIVTAAGGAANGIKFDNVTGGTIGDGTVANANVVTGFDNGASVIDSYYINVTGNLFADNNTGVFVDPSTNVSVDHNIIIGGATGVWMLNSDGNSISYNAIGGQSADGVLVENSNNTNVANNAILLVNNGVHLKNSNDVTVDTNTIVAANDGVVLNNSKRADVFGNIIGAGHDGIRATNHSNYLSAYDNGIVAVNDAVSLNRSNHATLNNNLLVAGHDGVNAVRSDDLAANSNVIFAANNGVNLSRSDDATLTNNAIFAGNDGVHGYRSNYLTVDGGLIMAGHNGVDLNRSRHATVENALIFAANDGVNTYKSDDLTVDNSYIFAGRDGVHVVGSNGNIVTNNFIFAGHNGVDFLNSDPLVAGNFILAANDGVHAVGTNDLLVLNNIIFAGHDGVYANGGNNLLVGGNVILAGHDGVHIANETGFVGVALNLIGAGRDGVHVYNTDGVVVGANVIGAGRDGVHANDTNGLLVVANAIIAGRDGVHTTDGSLLGVVANLIIAGHDGVNTNNTDGQLVALNAILAGRDGVHNVNSDAAVIAGNGILAGRDGVHVENSLFNLVALNGILAGRDGVHIEDSALFAVAGNGILAGRDGVNVDDSIGFLVAGNGIAAKRDGVHVDDSALFAVAGNGILAGRDGVNVDDSIGFLVAGNGIAAKRDGVHVDDSALFAVAGNGILAGRDGVNVDDSIGLLVAGNGIAAKRDGVHVDDSALFAVAGNGILAGRDGVNVDDSIGFLVAGNGIAAKRDGVHVDDSALFAVAGNGILAGRDGVNVDDSLLYGVAFNDINATRDGIHATDSIGNIFVGNTIDAGRDGIFGQNLIGNVIVGNKVNSSGRDGIHLVDSALNLILQNESTNAGRHGFNLENADYSYLADNTATGATGSGFRLVDSRDVLFTGNTATGNAIGFDADGGNDNITFISNTASNNLIGARVQNSDDVRFENNLFADNGIGALIVNTDDTVFSGDVFTGNTLGVNLNNSQRTRLEEVTIATPAGGTGIKIENGSGGTRVRDLTISGGAIGILLDGAGSSMQFEGNNSQFSGMDFYFVLQNAAMAGEVLDASQQFFDGTRAADFTFAQWLAAEAKTIDNESTFPVGDVFYKFFPANFSVRDEEDQKRKGLFRAGLFSYAGRTLNNNIEETPMTFEVRQLGTDLSLLNSTTVNPTTPAGIANFFATLAPAAGGNNTGGAKPGDLAQNLARLNPSAGGSSKPLAAGAAAGGCGNSFLDAGAALNFSMGACQ